MEGRSADVYKRQISHMNKKVILISIDGLRPDAVETCGHPFVNTLRENGCYSPDASSVVPPVTLPAHTSIFYSVPPIRHGIITNDYICLLYTSFPYG